MAARTQLWAFLSKLKQSSICFFFSVCEDRKEKNKAKEDLYIKLEKMATGNWQRLLSTDIST